MKTLLWNMKLNNIVRNEPETSQKRVEEERNEAETRQYWMSKEYKHRPLETNQKRARNELETSQKRARNESETSQKRVKKTETR